MLRFLAAYVILTGLMIGLGLLVAHALPALTRWDGSVNRWFVEQRVGALDTATQIGSHLAQTITVIAVAAIVVGGLAWWRHWTAAGLLVVAILLEVTVFLTTTLLVDRPRPSVLKLDSAPPTSSFPSGHTAASVALYIGLLIVARRLMHPTARRAAVTVVLALIPVAVGLSRLYRGMHHPSDVVGGLLLGGLCLVIAYRIVTAIAAAPDSPVALRRPAPNHALEGHRT